MTRENDQKTNPQNSPQRLGEILRQAGLISEAQIQVALEEQKIYSNLRIGEILALHGWISKETVNFFAQEWLNLLGQPAYHPIGYYFRRASLLNDQQIQRILHEHKRIGLRFGEVAVLNGFIKAKTLEFFLRHLKSSLTANLTRKLNQVDISDTTKLTSNASILEDEEDIRWIG